MEHIVNKYAKLIAIAKKYNELGNEIGLFDMKEALSMWAKAREYHGRAKIYERDLPVNFHESVSEPSIKARSIISGRIEVGDQIVIDRLIHTVTAIMPNPDNAEYLEFDLEPLPGSTDVYLKRRHATHIFKEQIKIGEY